MSAAAPAARPLEPPAGAAAGAPWWSHRARAFGAAGRGLAAVCSYGMPGFYNAAIDLGQRRALAPWLDPRPGAAVLDVGCGLGRWSRRLARRGAEVTGVDLSPAMIAEARRRARREGFDGRCRFAVSSLEELALGRRYPLILGVTVLQHIVDPGRLARALGRLAAHLGDGGRLVLLEAAPERARPDCETATFRARTAGEYRAHFAAAGLAVEAVGGVDPAPFKLWLLPRYRRLPRAAGLAALAAATALALPVDVALGRRLVRASWHKVFVLRR